MTLKPALVLAMVCCAAVDPADDAAFRGEQAVDQVHAPVAAEALVGTAAAELAPVRGSLDDKAALDKALDAATAWLDDHASPAPKADSDAQRKAPTHKERVAQRRREWKLNRTRTRDAKLAAQAHTHAESATCYGRRYPDLAYHFCKGGCDVHALHRHFHDYGRQEGRRFGCHPMMLAIKERETPLDGGCAKALVETQDVPIFYNLFVKSQSDLARVRGLVQEQLALARQNQRVFVHSIGIPMAVPNTTLIAHHNTGGEEVTLHSLWEHCRDNRSEKVIYLHSKGTFHASYLNDILRRFLTRGALSNECRTLPTSCNVCSSRMSPTPHPHTPGNMWLARCDYVSKLIDPALFRSAMGGRENPCIGQGRFALEHWIHSHPDAQPCDVYTNPAYVWGYSPLPKGDFAKVLARVPRYPWDTYAKNRGCGSSGQALQPRLDEYKRLYNAVPSESWWGWLFFGHVPVSWHQ